MTYERPKVNTKRRWLCWFLPHKFVEYADGCKRVCVRCEEEEWLHSRPFPLIGEAKYFWKRMNFKRLKF